MGHLQEDKEKICKWIMDMDIDDFYDLTISLTDSYINEKIHIDTPLFYNCSMCEKENRKECEETENKCKELFIRHYTKKGERLIMQKEMDTIQFESRRELEVIMDAVANYMNQNPSEKNNEILKDFYNKLDIMHMEW